MILVAIYSPLPALRAGLRALLSDDPEIQVVEVSAQLEAGDSLLEREAEQVDVIAATPGGLGSQPAPAGAAVLLVTSDPLEAGWLAGQGLRAWGVLSPEASGEMLREAVRALASGLVVLSPEISLGWAAPQPSGAEDDLAGQNQFPVPLPPGEAGLYEEPLTPRETEVLRRMAEGLTNKAIARALGISEHTVKFHVSSIYAKLNVANRAEAVRKGAKAGWVAI